MQFYRKILSVLTARDRRRYLVMIALGVVIAALEIVNLASVMPFLAVLANPEVIRSNAYLAMAYRWSGAESDRAFLTMIGIALFALIVASQSIRALISYQMIRFAQMCSHTLSTRLMERYLAQPYVWFLRNNSVDLRRTVMQEVPQTVVAVVKPSVQIVAQGLVILSLTAVLFVVDPVAAAVVMAVVGGMYGGLLFFTRPLLSRLGRQRLATNARRVMIASDALEGIKPVKLSRLEPYFSRQYSVYSRKFHTTFAKQLITNQLPRYTFQALLYGGIILLVLFMLSRSDGNFAAIVPTLGLYAVAAARMFPASQAIYVSLNQMKVGSAALDLVVGEFRRTEATATALAERQPEPLRMTRSLTLHDIAFRFPGAAEPVLNGLDLAIAANTTVGIVGGTGAGKTTTVDIILGLLTPDRGTIRVDDMVLTPETVARWQQRIGYVPQSIVLLDASIRANIAFGVPPEQIDDAAVERAARAAELHDFVTRDLPDGYRTKVGEGGNRLSGGQRQRIGIARALYHDPDLLVLDEATSALDNVTERQIIDSIQSLKKDKTVIMIAHRLTTVRQCDTIFLMEKGRVLASGSYDSLYGTDTAFRQLVDATA